MHTTQSLCRDDDVSTGGGTLAGAFADAGLLRDAAPSPEEMALAEANLPEEPAPESAEEVADPETVEEAATEADEQGDEQL